MGSASARFFLNSSLPALDAHASFLVFFHVGDALLVVPDGDFFTDFLVAAGDFVVVVGVDGDFVGVAPGVEVALAGFVAAFAGFVGGGFEEGDFSRIFVVVLTKEDSHQGIVNASAVGVRQTPIFGFEHDDCVGNLRDVVLHGGAFGGVEGTAYSW